MADLPYKLLGNFLVDLSNSENLCRYIGSFGPMYWLEWREEKDRPGGGVMKLKILAT